MKRCSYELDDRDSGGLSVVYDEPSVSDYALEKRNRTGALPLMVGPLVFNSSGTWLDKAVFSAQLSNLPGVHRLKPTTPCPVCLWSPHIPVDQYIEVDLEQVLQAINGKCIFVFDVRTDPNQSLLSDVVMVNWLVSVPLIKKYGIIVSKVPHPFNSNACPIPYIQDPFGELERLCKFESYLGPSVVCVNNGELVATCLLSRSSEALLGIFEEWGRI